MKKVMGNQKSREYGLKVRRSRNLEKGGTWFNNPQEFPCAFHDSEGVLIVTDEEHWQRLQAEPVDGSPYFKVSVRTNLKHPGIKGMLGYIPYALLTKVRPSSPVDSD